jgi:hypothetical protein
LEKKLKSRRMVAQANVEPAFVQNYSRWTHESKRKKSIDEAVVRPSVLLPAIWDSKESSRKHSIGPMKHFKVTQEAPSWPGRRHLFLLKALRSKNV